MQFWIKKDLWPDDVVGLKCYYHLSNEALSYLLPALKVHQQLPEATGYTIDQPKYHQMMTEFAANGDPIPDFARFLALISSLRRDPKDLTFMEFCIIVVPRNDPKPHGVICIVAGGEMRMTNG